MLYNLYLSYLSRTFRLSSSEGPVILIRFFGSLDGDNRSDISVPDREPLWYSSDSYLLFEAESFNRIIVDLGALSLFKTDVFDCDAGAMEPKRLETGLRWPSFNRLFTSLNLHLIEASFSDVLKLGFDADIYGLSTLALTSDTGFRWPTDLNSCSNSSLAIFFLTMNLSRIGSPSSTFCLIFVPSGKVRTIR